MEKGGHGGLDKIYVDLVFGQTLNFESCPLKQ